jgi:hypothetical protein
MYHLRRLGYIEQLDIETLFFSDVHLSANASDEEIWQICQVNGYYLLTGNRSAKDGEASLHTVLGRLANEQSVPVITISKPERVLNDAAYCQACAESIAQILSNAELYLGVPRLYIP